MKNIFIFLMFSTLTLSFGNIFTITDKNANELQSKDIEYIVKKGDNFYSIAKENNTTVNAIKKANGIKKVTPLTVGKVLRIPSKSTTIKKKKRTHIVPSKRQEKKLASTLKSVTFKKGNSKSSKYSINDIIFSGKSKKDIALEREYACLSRMAIALDDKLSDASTIARAVEFECRNYSDKYMYVVMPEKIKLNPSRKAKYIRNFRKGRTKVINNQSLIIILQNRKLLNDTQ